MIESINIEKCEHKNRCPACHEREWYLRRKKALEEVIYMLEANANCLFNNDIGPGSEWNLLLKMRDKLQKYVDKKYKDQQAKR